MKIRREIAITRNQLMREIIEQYTDGHSCSENRVEGMACIICALESLNKPLALLQYLRSRSSARRVFLAEAKLIELIGEEEYKRRTQIEVDLIRNVPKKPCPGCKKVVGLWMPYSLAAIYVNSREGLKLQVGCNHCGDTVLFDKTELIVTLKKRRNLTAQRLVAATLARNMGYEQPEARTLSSYLTHQWDITHTYLNNPEDGLDEE